MVPEFSFLQLKAHASHRIESEKELKIIKLCDEQATELTSKCTIPQKIIVPKDIPG